MFRFLLFFLIFVALTQNSVFALEQENFDSSSFRKNSLNAIFLKGNITSTIDGQTVSAYCRLTLIGTDSASMILQGPMGMIVARLYSTKTHFKFYSTITNEAFEGVPNVENLNKILKVPVSFYEFARLVRNEIPFLSKSYLSSPKKIDNNKLLFKTSIDKNFTEFSMFNADTTALEQFQRKSGDGTIILNCNYTGFQNFKGFNLPKKYVFKFPVLNGSVIFDVDVLEVNNPVETSFDIVIPKNYKKYTLD